MTQSRNPFEIELDKNDANYVPLSPLSFLRRTAAVYPNRLCRHPRRHPADLGGKLRALRPAGLGAVQARHRHRQHGGRHGAERAGNVRGALRRAHGRRRAQRAEHPPGRRSDRLHPQHGEAKVLITDREFSAVIDKAVRMIDPKHRPIVIDIDDPLANGGDLLGEHDYEAVPGRRAIPTSRGTCRRTNGRRSRSTTPRAPPATPRASSITIAAPI